MRSGGWMWTGVDFDESRWKFDSSEIAENDASKRLMCCIQYVSPHSSVTECMVRVSVGKIHTYFQNIQYSLGCRLSW